MARTAKQKAALRKAQLASAKKRKRRALGRNVGRGVIGSKRGSRKTRYKVARVVGAVAAGAAVAYGHHYAKNNLYYSKHQSSTSKSGVKYHKGHGTRKLSVTVGRHTHSIHHDPVYAKYANTKRKKR